MTQQTKHIRRILLATDFSENSLAALDYALELAKAFDAQLYLLHVRKQPLEYDSYLLSSFQLEELEKEATRAARQALLSLIETRIGEQVQVETMLAHGVPFATIVTMANQMKADLIVMGTHGRTRLPQMLIGSVAEKVVRNAPCPVLTVKHAGSLNRKTEPLVAHDFELIGGQPKAKTTQLSKKFIIGLVLIIGNFIVGKIAVPLFAIKIKLAAAIYLASWLMLLVGLCLCGRKGFDYARQYYRYLKNKFAKDAIMRLRRKQDPAIPKKQETPFVE